MRTGASGTGTVQTGCSAFACTSQNSIAPPPVATNLPPTNATDVTGVPASQRLSNLCSSTSHSSAPPMPPTTSLLPSGENASDCAVPTWVDTGSLASLNVCALKRRTRPSEKPMAMHLSSGAWIRQVTWVAGSTLKRHRVPPVNSCATTPFAVADTKRVPSELKSSALIACW